MATESSADESEPKEQKPEETASPTSIDGPETDQAVDDILHHESDEVIEVEDVKPFAVAPKPWYKKLLAKKKVWIPLVIVVLLVTVGAVPTSRYKLLGLYFKQTYRVSVIDSQTNLPVSDASVTLDGKTVSTNNQGTASLKVPVGKQYLSVSKKYYASLNRIVLVGIRSKTALALRLQATGRQVPLKVVDEVSGLPLSNVQISAAGTSAKTNDDGQVTMVLPADKPSVSATISGNGYNTAAVTLTVTASVLPANTFKLTPSGKVYFLSNASGTINVVSTNLDGTNRQTALAGTGNEDPNNTQLSASTDWRYLALIDQRTGTNPQLYVLSTANNQLMSVSSDNDSFQIIGWTSDDHLVYEETSNTIAQTQNGYQTLKSYDPATGQQITLDQTTATDLGNGLAAYESFYDPTLLVNNTLLYTTLWQGSVPQTVTQQGAIIAIQASTGKYKQDLQVLTPFVYYYASAQQTGPNNAYVTINQSSDNSTLVYDYNDGSFQSVSSLPASLNNNQSLVYDSSPSGTMTLWMKTVDGQTAVYTGDASGANAQQIATLDNTYSVYGWYGDNYILISKNNSELYIMPASGVSNQNQLLKITDYLTGNSN